MKVTPTALPEVLFIEPRVFKDSRGFFVETFQAERYRQAGIDAAFVQDNWSHSCKNTLRGLHFQNPNAQGKLVSCTRGEVFDVAVDVRVGSPRFGKWVGVVLSAENASQLWIPPGFAHGFCALTDDADFLYKCTALYDPSSDACVAWNDPDLGIRWPVTEPLLSPKDAVAPRLKDAARLPRYSGEGQ